MRGLVASNESERPLAAVSEMIAEACTGEVARPPTDNSTPKESGRPSSAMTAICAVDSGIAWSDGVCQSRSATISPPWPEAKTLTRWSPGRPRGRTTHQPPPEASVRALMLVGLLSIPLDCLTVSSSKTGTGT